MVDPQLQRLLICPKCHSELEFRARWIHCHACQSGYPVEGQIPVMLTRVSNDGFGHDLYRAQLHGNFFEKVFHTNRIETLLRLIGNDGLCEVHLKDWNTPLLGSEEGMVDMPAAAAALRDIGFDKWLVLETSGREDRFLEDTRANVAWAKQTFQMA